MSKQKIRKTNIKMNSIFELNEENKKMKCLKTKEEETL